MGARLCLSGTAVLASALAFAGTALAAKPKASAQPVASRVYVQSVPLSPHTGAPHGEAGASGAVTVCLDPSSGAVAYNFTALMLADKPTRAQIREGTAGGSVVTFGAPGMIDATMGEIEWNDSMPAKAAVVSRLASSPHGYYVTVNTRAFPNGALRGRLTGWKKVSSDSSAASECAFS